MNHSTDVRPLYTPLYRIKVGEVYFLNGELFLRVKKRKSNVFEDISLTALLRLAFSMEKAA